MNPRMEELLERVDSKFTLVTLSAMRAREINDYYNQLGEGLGKIVPPQVTSVSRKPLSIAMEEIEVGKIESVPLPTEEELAEIAAAEAAAAEAAAAEALAAAPDRGVALTGLRGSRIVLGVSGGIAAYKAVEVCRRLVDAGAHVVAGAHRRRAAVRRRAHVLGAGVGAGPHVAVRPAEGSPSRSRTPASARAPTW